MDFRPTDLNDFQNANDNYSPSRPICYNFGAKIGQWNCIIAGVCACLPLFPRETFSLTAPEYFSSEFEVERLARMTESVA
ncbi:hypothetical protein [Paraburkholderia aromaticivorans]|uniref:hypothetical protein n=1 Tax=Paraburkholderia aromaticivorans TaxID=2026199 RepID=UPI0014561477|nr:hypothetical protein [Paraburkholderia aromaticivorans]